MLVDVCEISNKNHYRLKPAMDHFCERKIEFSGIFDGILGLFELSF